jgi:hypothetical protein
MSMHQLTLGVLLCMQIEDLFPLAVILPLSRLIRRIVITTY